MPNNPSLPDIRTIAELLSITELALGPAPYALPADWPGIVQAAEKIIRIVEHRGEQETSSIADVWQEACQLLGQRAASTAVILQAVDDVLVPSLSTGIERLRQSIHAIADGDWTLTEQAAALRRSVDHHRNPELDTGSRISLPPLELLHELMEQVDAYWSVGYERTGWPGAILQVRRVVCIERGISDDTWTAAAASIGPHASAVAVVMAAARYCLGTISNPDQDVRSVSGRHARRLLDFDSALRRLLTEIRLAQTPPTPPYISALPSIQQVRALYLQASKTVDLNPQITTAPIDPELRHREPDPNEWTWPLLIDRTRRQYSAQHPYAADDYLHAVRSVGLHAATVLVLLAQCRHPGSANEHRGSFLDRTLRLACSRSLNLSEVVARELRFLEAPSTPDLRCFEPGPKLEDLKKLLPEHVWFPPAADTSQSWGWTAIVEEIPRLATTLQIPPDTLGAVNDELTDQELAAALLFASPTPSFSVVEKASVYLDLAAGRSQRIPARTMRHDVRLVTDLIDNELMRVATYAALGSTINPDALPTLDEAFSLHPPLLFTRLVELGLYPPRPDQARLLAAITTLIHEHGQPISEDSWRRAAHIFGPRGAVIVGILLTALIPHRPESSSGPHDETLDTYLTSLVCGEITHPGHLGREIETALDIQGFFELGNDLWPIVATAKAPHDPSNPRHHQGPNP